MSQYSQGWGSPGNNFAQGWGGINFTEPAPGGSVYQGNRSQPNYGQNIYQPTTGVGQAVAQNNLGGLIDLQTQQTQQAQDKSLQSRQQATQGLQNFANQNNLAFNQLTGQLNLNGNPFDQLFNNTRGQIQGLLSTSNPVAQTDFERQLQQSIAGALNTPTLSPQQIEQLATIGNQRIAATTNGLQNQAQSSLAQRGLQGSGLETNALSQIKQDALGQLQQNLNDATIQGATLNRQGLAQAQGAGQQYAGLEQQRLQHNQDLGQQQQQTLAGLLSQLTGAQAASGQQGQGLAINSLLQQQGQQGGLAQLIASLQNTQFQAPDYSGFAALGNQQAQQNIGNQQQQQYLNMLSQQQRLTGLQQFSNTSDGNIRAQLAQMLGLQPQNNFTPGFYNGVTR